LDPLPILHRCNKCCTPLMIRHTLWGKYQHC